MSSGNFTLRWAEVLDYFILGGAGEMGNGVVVNIREALDERVFVRDLAALVFGMLLGSGPRAIR